MAAPVTGPIVIEVNGTTPDTPLITPRYDLQRRWKQAKPFTTVLPYFRKVAYASGTVDSPFGARAVSSDLDDYDVWAPLLSAARGKLVARISSRAELLTAAFELGESCGMIERRALQLARAFSALRRRDFSAVNRALNAPRNYRPKGWRKRARDTGGLWLEYSFGWAPLVGDIQNAVDVLQEPIKSVFVSATAKGGSPEAQHLSPKILEVDPDAVYPYTDYSYSHRYKVFQLAVVRMGAEIGIENPNLWLANQLGLVNPFKTAYELIPFSFLLDWVGNVSQFLFQGTDFLGLSLQNAYTTRFMRGSYSYKSEYSYHWFEPVWGDPPYMQRYSSTYKTTTSGVFATMDRQLGISNATLTTKPALIPNWRRAANAVALLLGTLRG